MIARTWHGIVPKSKSKSYYKYLQETGLKDYTNIEGNLGVQVLSNDEGNLTHFLLVSFWESMSAIEKFAGKEYTKARYYPKDADYLLKFEEHVHHYDVLSSQASKSTRFSFYDFLKGCVGHSLGVMSLHK